MRICILLPYKKITGAVLPMIILAKGLSGVKDVDTTVLAKGKKIIDFCDKEGINCQEFSFVSLIKESLSSDVILTLRSSDTFKALILAFIVGNTKVYRLNFYDKRIFFDKFIKVIEIDRLGWIDPTFIGKKAKSKRISACVVSRLKPGRDLFLMFDELRGLKTRLRVFIIGRGEMLDHLKKQYAGSVNPRYVFFSKRVKHFFDVLSCMDVMFYPKIGSDKSARSVLEAFINKVVVFTTDFYALRYVDHLKTGAVSLNSKEIDSLLNSPSLLKKMALNGYRKAQTLLIEKRAKELLKDIS